MKFFIIIQLISLFGCFVAAFPGIDILLPKAFSSQKRPTIFTPHTDCKQWLRKNNRVIFYPYGRNASANGADALSKCLGSSDAVGHLAKFSDIFIVFPGVGEVSDEQEPLKQIVRTLPGPLAVRWPMDQVSRLRRNKFEAWQRAHQPRKVRKCFYYSTYEIPHWEDQQGDLLPQPTFTECGIPAVEMQVYYRGSGDRPLTDLLNHMKTCDDVRALSLSIRDGGGFFVDWDAPFSFDFKHGDVFPSALESLTVSGYGWDDGSSYWGLSQAQAWSAAMDWSSLKRLDLDRPPQSFLDAFATGGRLRNLESLTIRPHRSALGTEEIVCGVDDDDEDATAARSTSRKYLAFITSLPPLRDLHLSGLGELHLPIEPILARHGHRLRSLTIHELERERDICGGGGSSGADSTTGNNNNNNTTTPNARPFIDVETLEQIKKLAPNLRALTVDLYRNATHFPNEELAVLATFPALEALTLHFDLEDPGRSVVVSDECGGGSGVYHDDQPVKEEEEEEEEEEEAVMVRRRPALLEPRIGADVALAMFDFLLGPRDEGVRRLDVVVGNYGRDVGAGGLASIDACDEPNWPFKYECRAEDGACNRRFGGAGPDFGNFEEEPMEGLWEEEEEEEEEEEDVWVDGDMWGDEEEEREMRELEDMIRQDQTFLRDEMR